MSVEMKRMSQAHSDKAESLLRDVDQVTTKKAGISLFHILTLVSMVTSIYLFMTGRRFEGIFVGLWPPTFQALKSASENA